jgi:hypothetical protein
VIAVCVWRGEGTCVYVFMHVGVWGVGLYVWTHNFVGCRLRLELCP